MSKKVPKKNNLRLAGIFIILVAGLILMSLLLKLAFIVKDSKFDGVHKFNVVLRGTNQTEVVSFSPNPNSISVLTLANAPYDVSKFLAVPIDGQIKVNGSVNSGNIASILLNSEFPLGNSVTGLTPIDLLRLFLLTKSVSSDSIYVRSINSGLSQTQISTLISLTFTDPEIYRENQSIEVVNSTQVNGLGARISSYINNIGGNVILVTSSSKEEDKSKVEYSGQDTYTVDKLSSFFGIPKEQIERSGIADVIIIIGKDIAQSGKY